MQNWVPTIYKNDERISLSGSTLTVFSVVLTASAAFPRPWGVDVGLEWNC